MKKQGIDILSSHLDAVRALAFHPTELCLATGGDDCTVKIWRMEVASLASSAYVQVILVPSHAHFSLLNQSARVLRPKWNLNLLFVDILLRSRA